ncbi:MAG: HPr family phosphocarrier protein [Clostridia bacterium]|nr:HPr family phosphocarrier protein [Clostridia bacterium]
MVKQDVLITNPTGIHARPATMLVDLSKKFESNIVIEFEGIKINPKSILSVLSGELKSGKKISVDASGPDANEAVNAICNFIRTLKE